MPLWGFRDAPVHTINDASRYFVYRLYTALPLPLRRDYNDHLERDRNDLIRSKHANGNSISDLAQEFDLSRARVHQILHHRRK